MAGGKNTKATRRTAREALRWAGPLASIALTLWAITRVAQQVVVTWRRVVLFDDETSPTAKYDAAIRIDAWLDALGTAGWVCFPIAALSFLFWLVVAIRSLRASPGLPTPGSAVAAYFIPFVNLYRPLQHMLAVYDATHARPLAQPAPAPLMESDYRSSARPARSKRTLERSFRHLVKAWWAAWMASLFLTITIVVADRASRHTSYPLRMVQYGLGTAGILLAALLAWALSGRLAKKRRAAALDADAGSLAI